MSDLGIIVPTTTNFKLHQRKFLLTYKTHINKELLIEWFSQIYDLKEFGVCHETSEDGYEHTHFLVHTAKQPSVTDANKFDYNDNENIIHPNIKKLLTTTHYNNVFNYLHKQDKNVYTNITADNFDKNVKTQNLIDKIEKCKSWGEVLRHDDIKHDIRWCKSWASDIFNSKPKIMPKCNINYKTLTKWQKNLYIKLKSAPVEREIIWVWSDKSKQGKSTFVKYLQNKLNVFCVKRIKNLDDIGYCYNNESVLIIDLPRSKSKLLENNLKDYFIDNSHIKYNNDNFLSIIETLSDHGSYNCGKYDGKYVIFNCHIVILSNCSNEYVDKYLPNRIYSVEAKLDEPII